jgi:hypothetical protein
LRLSACRRGLWPTAGAVVGLVAPGRAAGRPPYVRGTVARSPFLGRKPGVLNGLRL